MAQPQQLSNAQLSALEVVRNPTGWDTPNSGVNPYPLPYYNSYDNPAYVKGYGALIVDLGMTRLPNSNQFNTAVSQSARRQKGGRFEVHNKFMTQPVRTNMQMQMYRKPMYSMDYAQKGSGMLETTNPIPGVYADRRYNPTSNQMNSARTQPFAMRI